jgi:hypothetical protein
MVGFARVAPDWTHANGLDFWNLGNDKASLSNEIDEGRNWDNALELVQRRREATVSIAYRLCEGSITLDEAVDSITALAQTLPDWLPALRVSYRETGAIPQTATERDVVTCYLLITIRGMLHAAESLNETSRAAFLSASITRLDEEVRLHAKQTLANKVAH